MTQDGAALVREYFASIDRGRLADTVALLAPDYRVHIAVTSSRWTATACWPSPGRPSVRGGLRHLTEDQVTEGDRLVSRITVQGTHDGELMSVPPTGRMLSFQAMNVHRFDGDQVIEQWIQMDALGLLRQLGVIPTPEAAVAVLMGSASHATSTAGRRG